MRSKTDKAATVDRTLEGETDGSIPAARNDNLEHCKETADKVIGCLRGKPGILEEAEDAAENADVRGIEPSMPATCKGVANSGDKWNVTHRERRLPTTSNHRCKHPKKTVNSVFGALPCDLRIDDEAEYAAKRCRKSFIELGVPETRKSVTNDGNKRNVSSRDVRQ